LTIFTLLPQDNDNDFEITGIKIESGLGSTLDINSLIDLYTIYPRVRLVSKGGNNKDNNLKDIKIVLELTDLVSDESYHGDLCNLDKRK
jgi:hypothetical protein